VPVLLALLATLAFVWFRSDPAEHGLARIEDRKIAATMPDLAPELGLPEPVGSGRSDAAPIVASAPSATATSAAAWTGVRVRILASETRAPLANVRLTARIEGARQSWRNVDDFHGKLGHAPRTDERGVAELDDGTTCTITAHRDDGSIGPGSAKLETPLAAGEVREFEILVPTQPDLVFHGRGVDRETNAPIPNARVGRSQGWSKILDADEQLTDGDGRFRVSGTSWSRTVVNVLARGYEEVRSQAPLRRSRPPLKQGGECVVPLLSHARLHTLATPVMWEVERVAARSAEWSLAPYSSRTNVGICGSRSANSFREHSSPREKRGIKARSSSGPIDRSAGSEEALETMIVFVESTWSYVARSHADHGLCRRDSAAPRTA